MSRTTSIASVRPLGWLARVRAQCSRLAWECPAQFLAAGAAGPGPITALGMGARDDHARQRSEPGQGHAFLSALPLAWLRALTRMIIARSHGQSRDWPRGLGACEASACPHRTPGADHVVL